MLRAIFVTGSLAHGGAERQTIALLNRLAERGHECHAVFVKNSDSLLDRVRLRTRGTVRCLGARHYLDLRAVAGFAEQLSAVEPSVLVAANPYALMYCTLASRWSRLRAPLVATFHSTRVLGAKERLKMLFYRPCFWNADCTVFVCERQRRYWMHRGVFSRRNEVIYNGVDTAEFCDAWNARERARTRAALGFSEADYVIGISAVLRPEKNHVQLVDAIAVLRSRGIRARGLMIGDGETRAAIEARARALGVDRDVAITGAQQDVRPYLAACDVVALCSVTEAFSLGALEAMAMHKPIVHSNVGGATEMIRPGWNGFVFPVGDTRAFADRLAVLADREVCRRMGDHARQAVKAFFSDTTMVNRYEQTLIELCRARSSAAAAPSW